MKFHVKIIFENNSLQKIIVSFKIYIGKHLILEKEYKTEEKLDILSNKVEESEKLDANVLKILKTMKLCEKSICHIKFAAFESNSTNLYLLEKMNSIINSNNIEKNTLFVDIEV